MKHEQLIVQHMGHAIKMARQFDKGSPAPDATEAESIALFALVRAAGRFDGTSEDGGMFWQFARPAIAGALTDHLRSRYGRWNRRRFVRLIETHAAFHPSEPIDARLTIAGVLPL